MRHKHLHTISISLLISFTISLPTFALARGFGELGIHLASDRIEDQTPTGTTSASSQYLRADIAAGWQSRINDDRELSYGIVFNSSRGFQSSSGIAGYALGAFVGWYQGPFSARLDYLILAEQKSNNGTVETQYHDGSGFALEARWLHWFGDIDDGKKFAIGPAVAFSQMRFSKSRVGTLPDSSDSRKTESLTPGLRGLFLF